MTNYYKSSSQNYKPKTKNKESVPPDAAGQYSSPEGEKLQKVIARSGHASRREAERLIAQRRVKIDKRIAQLGDRVNGSERIYLDDNELFIAWEKPRQRVLVYNKPPGEICSRKDPDHPNTIFDDLPSLKIGRWISVGFTAGA